MMRQRDRVSVMIVTSFFFHLFSCRKPKQGIYLGEMESGLE